MSKGKIIAADVSALLRARNMLLWIVTREEERTELLMIEACASAGYIPQTWDVAQGFCDMNGKVTNAAVVDPGDAIGSLMDAISGDRYGKNERTVTLMRDLPVWISGAQGAATLRKLRNFARQASSATPDRAQAIIILSPSGDVPPELSNHVTVLELPMPDREEIAAVLDATLRNLSEDMQKTAAPNGTRDAAIDAAVGLTSEEASSCYAKSLVQLRRIDPVAVAQEKKRVIARERILEWFDPLPGGLDAVGGLDNLKDWLKTRRGAYSAAAREYGLPSPKGAMLVGIPGCGKSLTAKATATAFGCPLLKIDLGALKSKFVGESEQNLRKAFKVIEAIGRCVVWFDEIEKSLQGATSGSSDGGVSSDALGAVLNWMQERQGEAFVIATANDVSSLPPELLRKGRFDEIFFVDLPNTAERIQIMGAALRAHNQADPSRINFDKIADATGDFTGSEIAAIVPDAMFRAFEDNVREITTDDLVWAAKRVVPLSVTAQEKIKALRDWAATRARRASSIEVPTDRKGGRVLDI
jgi:SpoVK/Ycf46/Vps4 family AAA+-type ATPase